MHEFEYIIHIVLHIIQNKVGDKLVVFAELICIFIKLWKMHHNLLYFMHKYSNGKSINISITNDCLIINKSRDNLFVNNFVLTP